MIRILFSFALLLSVTAIHAQPGRVSLNLNTEEETPDLTFEEEVIDYGDIALGSNGDREFVFTNTSGDVIVIDKCEGSCGCTTPICPIEPIMPGETIHLPVNYDTNRPGKFHKTVTITYNNGKTKKVTITGNVITS